MTPRRIALLGGHGKIALLATPLLLAAGHEVVSVIRDPGQSDDVEEAGAAPLVADLEHLDQDETDALLGGFDTIVWAAGAGGGSPRRTRAVDHDAAVRSMVAAEHGRARRYVMVSYFGAGPDHGTSPGDDFFPYAQAKSQADARLQQSGLDFTVLRPSRLTDDPATGRIDVGADRPAGQVPRADVAATVVAALADDSTIGGTFAFNTGSTPIAQALHR